MTVRDSSDTILDKTALTGRTSAWTDPDPIRVVNETVYEALPTDGEQDFESTSRRILFHAGQRVRQSDIDALYPDAAVSAVSPATGAAAGGTTVAITGVNLAGVTGVTFDGDAATNVTVVSNSRVTCTTPAHAAGAVDVVVDDDGADVTVTNGFTYQ